TGPGRQLARQGRRLLCAHRQQCRLGRIDHGPGGREEQGPARRLRGRTGRAGGGDHPRHRLHEARRTDRADGAEEPAGRPDARRSARRDQLEPRTRRQPGGREVPGRRGSAGSHRRSRQRHRVTASVGPNHRSDRSALRLRRPPRGCRQPCRPPRATTNHHTPYERKPMFGALELGLIYGAMALGVYLTFKVLNFPDLTVDGSVTTGGATAASLIIAGVNPFLATLAAIGAGLIAGYITGLLHTKGGIDGLLAGILTMIGLWSINLRIMGKANL